MLTPSRNILVVVPSNGRLVAGLSPRKPAFEPRPAHVAYGADKGTMNRFFSEYRYVPYNDVLVNDGPHIQRWSHKIIL